MSPIQGFTRYRKHQFGRQSSLGSKIAATRAYPFSGVPSTGTPWVDPDIDAGSIDTVASPYRGPSDLSASLTAPTLRYNDLPLMLAAYFGGGQTATPAGLASDWAWAPASATVDDVDVFTYEFGDDVTTDWFQFGDSLLESLEIAGPEGLGACTASMGWRMGSFASSGSTDFLASPTVPTGGLSVSVSDATVYLKDAGISIGSDPYSLSQVSDALHTFTLRLSQTLDQKRFANASQTFDVSAYGRATRSIELECVFAKTSDTIGTGSESDAWMSDQAVNRYVSMTFTSLEEADTLVPYSWTFTMPMRYYTRAETESGGNTTVTLTGRAFYDPDGFGGVFTTEVVNTLAAL